MNNVTIEKVATKVLLSIKDKPSSKYWWNVNSYPIDKLTDITIEEKNDDEIQVNIYVCDRGRSTFTLTNCENLLKLFREVRTLCNIELFKEETKFKEIQQIDRDIFDLELQIIAKKAERALIK